MKKLFTFSFTYLLTYLLTCLIIFNPLDLNSQTTNTYIANVPVSGCDDVNGNPICNEIIIQVTTRITDNTMLECGEFDVSVEFNVLTGATCLEDIGRIRWYTSPVDYNSMENSSVHFSDVGDHTLKLQFMVDRICSPNIIKEINYPVTTTEDCDGCESAKSYCDLYCNPLPIYKDVDPNNPSSYCKLSGGNVTMPVIHEIWLTTLPKGHVKLNSTNNYGIFNFPYYGRAELQCPKIAANGLHTLVNDLNEFLDLSQSGKPGTEKFSGHVNLMDSYGITYKGITDYCKIRIKFVDCGLFFWGFHIIKLHGFDLATCSMEPNPVQVEDEHFDKRFPTDYCVFGNENNLELIINDSTNIFSRNIDKNNSFTNNSFDCLVYPYITSNYANIEVARLNDRNFYLRGTITDLSGKTLDEFIIDEIQLYKRIDVSTYNPGLYLMQLTNNNGQTIIKKFIKH